MLSDGRIAIPLIKKIKWNFNANEYAIYDIAMNY